MDFSWKNSSCANFITGGQAREADTVKWDIFIALTEKDYKYKYIFLMLKMLSVMSSKLE